MPEASIFNHTFNGEVLSEAAGSTCRSIFPRLRLQSAAARRHSASAGLFLLHVDVVVRKRLDVLVCVLLLMMHTSSNKALHCEYKHILNISKSLYYKKVLMRDLKETWEVFIVLRL